MRCGRWPGCLPTSMPPTVRLSGRPTCVLRLMTPTRKRDLAAVVVIGRGVAQLPPGAVAVPVVPAADGVDRAVAGRRRRGRGRSGAATCGRRSAAARSVSAVAGCIRSRWRAVSSSPRRRPGSGRWCSAGGSACWPICCPGAASCGWPVEDTAGAVVAAVCALALLAAALWLQHCCKSPQDPSRQRRTASRIVTAGPPREQPGGIAEQRDTRSDLARVQSAHDRSVPRRPGSARRPQAGMAALDSVAGARHCGQFSTCVHQSGGAVEAGGHPVAVGGGGGCVRLGDLPQAERRRPGQGAGPEDGLRPATRP